MWSHILRYCVITGTKAEYQSDAGSTKDTPYLALTGELWGVLCKHLWENWSCYNGTAPYVLLGPWVCFISVSVYQIREGSRVLHVFWDGMSSEMIRYIGTAPYWIENWLCGASMVDRKFMAGKYENVKEWHNMGWKICGTSFHEL